MPGIKVAINFERPSYVQFSHGFDFWRQERLRDEEIAILQFINDTTEKKGWHTDIKDYSIWQTWKKEAVTKYFAKFPTSTTSMLWEWCLFELQKKADDAAKLGYVSVLDSASHVRKCDTLLDTDMLEIIKTETSDLDISPWMYPYIFRHTPVRADGVDVTLNNMADCIGTGSVPLRGGHWENEGSRGPKSFYSNKSQWLATDIKFTGSRNENTVKIVSPINDLDPEKHKSLYSAIESVIFHAIRHWDGVLLYKTLARGVSRIEPRLKRCRSCFEAAATTCECKIKFREFSAWANDNLDNSMLKAYGDSDWNLVAAMNGDYVSSRGIYDKISLRKGFEDRGLQVYVETMNFHIKCDGSISGQNVP